MLGKCPVFKKRVFGSIICSTVYAVIGFLQFASIHLFKLYLVYVLTVANISMSQILFAKESQILFAKESL